MTGQPAGQVPSSHAKLEIEYESLASDVYEIRMVGELGMGSVNSLDRVIKGIFEQGIYRIVINLEGTYYIASSGIGILIASTETARENGGDFIFAGMTPRVKHVFDLMGLGGSMRFAPNAKEALKMFKKGAKV